MLPQCDGVIIGQTFLNDKICEEINKLEPSGEVHYLPELAERALKRIPLKSILVKHNKDYHIEANNETYSPAMRILDIFGIINCFSNNITFITYNHNRYIH